LEERRCGVCGALLDPISGYRCRRCGGWFCVYHHLPELHQCPGLKRGPSEEGYWFKPVEVKVEAPRQLIRVKLRLPLMTAEVKDLAISTLVLAIAFSILSQRGLLLIHPLAVVQALPTMLLAVVTAFVLHELSHRFTAKRRGYWAEYRAWPPGLILALASSFLGFLFAAPGAVFIEGAVDRRDHGLIAMSGPTVNVAVALLLKLLGLSALWPLGWVAEVNAWIGLFNLLPLPPLDGYKVAMWSLPAWGAAMAVGVAALLLVSPI